MQRRLRYRVAQMNATARPHFVQAIAGAVHQPERHRQHASAPDQFQQRRAVAFEFFGAYAADRGERVDVRWS